MPLIEKSHYGIIRTNGTTSNEVDGDKTDCIGGLDCSRMLELPHS